jgi:hypothetical protein
MPAVQTGHVYEPIVGTPQYWQCITVLPFVTFGSYQP